jgi:hypothetical protein
MVPSEDARRHDVAVVLVHVVVLALLVGVAPPAPAQTVIAPTEQLAFDRPESWALQYFTSASFLTGLGTAAAEHSGAIRIELESGWLPTLTPAQEHVGFAGTKGEDLNKAPVFFRPRVRVGLPAHLALIAGGVPPIRAFGVTPRLAALGVEWAMQDTGTWRLAWRLHGETGTVTGAFTCPETVLASPPGSGDNPTGCETRSSDVVTLRYGALEFDVAHRVEALGHLVPHVGVAVNGIDSHFQVNAHTFGQIDRTRLYARGLTWSMSAGASLPVGPRLELSGDAFYTPLTVRRDATGPRVTDGLFNIRALLSYRIRR